MDTIYSCFNCSKRFKESEMKSKDVPNNFTVLCTESQSTGKVDQCPHCDAVAFVGFNIVK